MWSLGAYLRSEQNILTSRTLRNISCGYTGPALIFIGFKEQGGNFNKFWYLREVSESTLDK